MGGPMMSIDDLDDWDSAFLDHAVRVEHEIISISSSRYSGQQQQQPPSSNFSPPREFSLSQFPPPPAAVDEEVEVDRLKRDFRRVSQDLSHLEQECAELKKDREEKEQLLKSFHQTPPIKQETVLQHRIHISRFQNASTSTPPVEDMDNHSISFARSERLSVDGANPLQRLEPPSNHQLCPSYVLKGKNVQVDIVPPTIDCRPNILLDTVAVNSSESSILNLLLPAAAAQPKYTKAVGVQTDTDDGYEYLTGISGSHSQNDIFIKFSAIWRLPSSQTTGRSLVSKLFMLCATDFYALFRCMGMSMPSTMESPSDACLSTLALHDKSQHIQSPEAAKVARLYFILTKINCEMLQLDALFDALMDLCTLDKAVVVRSSLRVLRVILQLVPGWNAKPVERDNIMVEGMHPGNSTEICKSRMVDTGEKFGLTSKCSSFLRNDSLDWLMLFETIRHIAAMRKEESIQVEAISVMNLILMRSDPCLEREKFGSRYVFENLSRLLQKDVGLQVRREALHLLFLLLNCPKILLLFCCGGQDCATHEAAADSTKDDLVFQSCSTILEGVAECVKCRGHNTEELKLRRLSIKVLAFVASSGKSGFEVLVNPKISKGVSFLELIVQAMALEMDAEAAESTEISETSKERTSFIREALILLNRIASSPAYSGALLQVLTSSRDTMSLTIDVVNKMSRTGREWWKPKKRKAEDEIVDLARVFRSRVFAYLGNT